MCFISYKTFMPSLLAFNGDATVGNTPFLYSRITTLCDSFFFFKCK